MSLIMIMAFRSNQAFTFVKISAQWVISPPNSICYKMVPSYFLFTLLLYFLFIFYMPRCTPLDFPSITYYLRNFYLVIEQQQRRLFGPNSYGTFRGRRKELLFSDHFFLIRTVLLTFFNDKFIGFSYYTIWRPSLPPFPLLELRN